MDNDMLVVRKVDKRVYRQFRQKAIAENTSLGTAITDAMKEWLSKKEHRQKVDIKNLHKLEGIIKVGRKVRWSEQIDETLYG